MIVTEKEFNKAVEIVIQYKQQILNHYNARVGIGSVNKKSDLVRQSNMSVRTLNILKAMVYSDSEKRDALNPTQYWLSMQITDLRRISVKKLLTQRCCGKRSIDEIKELAASAGITLKP